MAISLGKASPEKGHLWHLYYITKKKQKKTHTHFGRHSLDFWAPLSPCAHRSVKRWYLRGLLFPHLSSPSCLAASQSLMGSLHCLCVIYTLKTHTVWMWFKLSQQQLGKRSFSRAFSACWHISEDFLLYVELISPTPCLDISNLYSRCVSLMKSTHPHCLSLSHTNTQPCSFSQD